jgi:hypothetical protein
MKKLLYWSKSYLLPLCLVLVLGLMSCEQEEIIPLAEEDAEMTEASDDYMYNDVIVGDDGEVVGYIDNESNILDVKGNIIESKNLRDESNGYFTKVSVYKDSKFRGRNRTFHSYSTNNTIYISSSTLRNEGMHDNISGLVVPPYCNVTIYEHSDRSGRNSYFGSGGSKAKYKSYVGSHMNDKTSAIKIQCNSSGRKQTLCGYAYKHTSWGGDRLALYWNTPISYSESKSWGYNDNISGVSMNSNSLCNTRQRSILLSSGQYDKSKVDNPGNTYEVKTDRSSLGSFNDKTSSIIPGGDYYTRESDYGMSSSETSQIRSQARGIYSQNNTSPGTLTSKESRFCSASKDFCEQTEYIFDNSDGFVGVLACPGITAIVNSHQAVVDFDSGYWLASIFDGVKAGLEAAVEVGEMMTVPEAAVAGCVVMAAEKAVELGDQNHKSCDQVYNDCVNGLR